MSQINSDGSISTQAEIRNDKLFSMIERLKGELEKSELIAENLKLQSAQNFETMTKALEEKKSAIDATADALRNDLRSAIFLRGIISLMIVFLVAVGIWGPDFARGHFARMLAPEIMENQNEAIEKIAMDQSGNIINAQLSVIRYQTCMNFLYHLTPVVAKISEKNLDVASTVLYIQNIDCKANA